MVAGAASIVCVACVIAVLIFTVALLDKNSRAAITATANAKATLAAARTKTARPAATAKPVATPLPATDTPLSIGTSGPAATSVEPPLLTDTPVPPPTQSAATSTSTSIPAALVEIVTVNKQAEYVEIRNIGHAPQNLIGWVLVSEEGGQQCPLSGVLLPGVTLRIWALDSDRGQGGFNCGFEAEIWDNDNPDPAVLLDATGHEVSRK
jgi:Lamin Tail Domain